MASCTIPLKPKIVHINVVKSEYKKTYCHGAITVSIVCNVCFIFIFKEIWADDASITSMFRKVGTKKPIVMERLKSPLCVTFALSLFSKKYWAMMFPLHKPHHTVTPDGCISFCNMGRWYLRSTSRTIRSLVTVVLASVTPRVDFLSPKYGYFIWCVACCTIPLKPNIVHINVMKSEYKKTYYHGAINVFIVRNVCFVLIFEEIWADDASAPQAAPYGHS